MCQVCFPFLWRFCKLNHYTFYSSHTILWNLTHETKVSFTVKEQKLFHLIWQIYCQYRCCIHHVRNSFQLNPSACHNTETQKKVSPLVIKTLFVFNWWIQSAHHSDVLLLLSLEFDSVYFHSLLLEEPMRPFKTSLCAVFVFGERIITRWIWKKVQVHYSHYFCHMPVA